VYILVLGIPVVLVLYLCCKPGSSASQSQEKEELRQAAQNKKTDEPTEDVEEEAKEEVEEAEVENPEDDDREKNSGPDTDEEEESEGKTEVRLSRSKFVQYLTCVYDRIIHLKVQGTGRGRGKFVRSDNFFNNMHQHCFHLASLQSFIYDRFVFSFLL
jgi:hypothetical protein